MEPLAVGAIVEVVVTRLEPYGAWLDYDGQIGLVRIPDISRKRIGHPADVLVVGQLVRVKILVAPTQNEFSASLRAVHPEDDPWYDPSRFAVGTEFVGRVVRVLEYGCFVELRPEVWGSLRRERWVTPPSEGDAMRVRVESVDVAARKVEVSLLLG